MGRLEGHRPFFALIPPPDAIAAIAAVRDAIGPVRQPMRDDRLHMTLLMIDDVPELTPELTAALLAAGDRVQADAPDVTLDRLVFAPGTALIVPGSPQPTLRAFQSLLTKSLADTGLPVRQGYRFSPHVTLAFRPDVQGERPIPPIRWTATDFVLIHSWVGLGRYDVLGRWPLRKQPLLP